MIRATAGAELCATSNHPHPKPVDCVKAIDYTYKGDVDISERVVVGEPVQKSALEWDVPYNVKDEAGNEAVTVWRHVIVQEVDLNSVEAVIRDEVEQEEQARLKSAIDAAVKKEKAQWQREQQASTSSRRAASTANKSCPACPKCDCPDTPETNMETCQSYCENVSKTCALSDSSLMYSIIFWMEAYLSPAVIPVVFIVVVLFGSFVILRFILTAIYNPDAYRRGGYENNYGTTSSEEDAILRGMGDSRLALQPFVSPTRGLAPMMNGNQTPQSSSYPPLGYTVPVSTGLPGAFSPPGTTTRTSTPGFASPPYTRSSGAPQDDHHSSYLGSPVITPSRRGDGVQRESRNIYS